VVFFLISEGALLPLPLELLELLLPLLLPLSVWETRLAIAPNPFTICQPNL